MLVKNAERDLAKCLDSVRDLASELIVVDTGSTDATCRIAAGYGAKVIPFDFGHIDFAAARNWALSQAGGSWILVLDADETLDPAGASQIKALVDGNENAGYFLERHNPGIDYVVRLFPNRPGYRYRGRVHETIDASILAGGGRLLKTAIRIEHNFVADPEARRRKNHWYIQILKEEIAAAPLDDARLDFLAAEYHQLEMFEEAAARRRGRRPAGSRGSAGLLGPRWPRRARRSPDRAGSAPSRTAARPRGSRGRTGRSPRGHRGVHGSRVLAQLAPCRGRWRTRKPIGIATGPTGRLGSQMSNRLAARPRRTAAARDNPVDWYPWGEEALAPGPCTRTVRCSSRSATRPATGAMSWSASPSRIRRSRR